MSPVSQIDLTQDTIIDLTLADDSDDALHTRPTPSSHFHLVDISGSNHGLILDDSFAEYGRDYGKSLELAAEYFSSLPAGASGRPDKSSRRKDARRTQTSNSRLKDYRQSENPAKRQRINQIPSGLRGSYQNGIPRVSGSRLQEHAEQPWALRDSKPPNCLLKEAAQKSLQEWVPSNPCEPASGNTGNLKSVLRTQIFPHINRCLSRYNYAIDEESHNQIGKKIATKLCGDKFQAHIEKNKGHLSASFHQQITLKISTLVDRLVHEVSESTNIVEGTHPKGSPNIKGKSRASGFHTRITNKEPTLTEQPVIYLSSSDDRNGSPLLEFPSRQPRERHSSSLTNSTGAIKPISKRKLSPQKVSQLQHKGQRSSLRQGRQLQHAIADLASQEHPGPEGAAGTIISAQYAGRNSGNPNRRFHRPKSHQKLLKISSLHEWDVQHLRISGHHGPVPRPYLSYQTRSDIEKGLGLCKDTLSGSDIRALTRSVLHVDFDATEIGYLQSAIESLCEQGHWSAVKSSSKVKLKETILRNELNIPKLLQASEKLHLFPGRSKSGIQAFLQDFAKDLISREPKLVRAKASNVYPRRTNTALSSIDRTLRAREIFGGRYSGRGGSPMVSTLKSQLEDTIAQEAEWTDCSGDVTAFTWLSEDIFVCGAITHSDAHNQQYNKPGNLLIGSVREKSLVSVAGHRIPRPIVGKGDNALPSMRETQDPWLYCSVTSVAYDKISHKCFTASFDHTVKAWDFAPNGSGMEFCGVWHHEGRVNFVVVSPCNGLVATAADTPRDAVRVYDLNSDDISDSYYKVYSGEKADERSGQHGEATQSWAYFPATIQWGKADSVAHLLLVGYSPRSIEGQDMDIPEDKVNTGELCLWDVANGNRISITSARTQNVFEVVWHPTMPMFLAATSAMGVVDDGVRTQIRLFSRTKIGTFSVTKTLDCSAMDINEITIMPNSLTKCYVTASGTDGKTYVWDTAQQDQPIHILSHGVSIDDQLQDVYRGEYDNGVKFASWGRSSARFYTGSSDGTVKAWDIRKPRGEAFIHDVISVSGGISAGSFCSDFSKLIIGDATGKVHLLSIEGPEPGECRPRLTRNPITPHSEPPPPSVSTQDKEIMPDSSAREIARGFLDRREIVIHPDEYIGAIQGPNYEATKLFSAVAHENQRVTRPVIETLRYAQLARYHQERVRIPRLPIVQSSSHLGHEKNTIQDLGFTDLDTQTRIEFEKDEIDVNIQEDDRLEFELEVGLSRSETLGEEFNLDQSFESSHFLDDSEIHEFQELKKGIGQELRFQRRLKCILDEIDSECGVPRSLEGDKTL